jgi:hypothetical protein
MPQFFEVAFEGGYPASSTSTKERIVEEEDDAFCRQFSASQLDRISPSFAGADLPGD